MHTLELFNIFLKPLNAAKQQYMITGAAAAIIYGEPRMTHDLDLVLNLNQSIIPEFIQLFPDDEFYVPPVEVLKIESGRKQRGHFNVIHMDTGLRADVYLLGEDSFHLWAMQHRQTVELDGETIWLAPIEYVIIRKLEYYREGNSQKHLEDIRNMLTVSHDKIDNNILSEFITNRKLNSEWETVSANK